MSHFGGRLLRVAKGAGRRRKNAVLHPHGIGETFRLRGAVGAVATVERRRCGSVMHNPHVSTQRDAGADSSSYAGDSRL